MKIEIELPDNVLRSVVVDSWRDALRGQACTVIRESVAQTVSSEEFRQIVIGMIQSTVASVTNQVVRAIAKNRKKTTTNRTFAGADDGRGFPMCNEFRHGNDNVSKQTTHDSKTTLQARLSGDRRGISEHLLPDGWRRVCGAVRRVGVAALALVACLALLAIWLTVGIAGALIHCAFNLFPRFEEK